MTATIDASRRRASDESKGEEDKPSMTFNEIFDEYGNIKRDSINTVRQDST